MSFFQAVICPSSILDPSKCLPFSVTLRPRSRQSWFVYDFCSSRSCLDWCSLCPSINETVFVTIWQCRWSLS